MVIISRDEVREPLFAIVPVQNAWRWKSRYKHVDRAIKEFVDAGAIVILVETAFNRREFVYADSGLDGSPAAQCRVLGTEKKFRHKYIALRSPSELWHKENMINVAAQMALPYDWEQVCWLDSDVQFSRPNWVGECIQKLQHFSFLQMFSHAQDLDPDYCPLPADYPHSQGVSFVQAWEDGSIESDVEKLSLTAKKLRGEVAGANPKIVSDVKSIQGHVEQLKKDLQEYPYPPRMFPGLAWACTRKAWDDVGGLIDVAIWGGGDWHTAHCLIERKQNMVRTDMHTNYQAIIHEWAGRCQRHIRKNVGQMSGLITHMWHGNKLGRGYNVKHKLLAKIGFDPLKHLKRDFQGLWQLHDDGSEAFVQLRDTMRVIATERNEDDIHTGLEQPFQGH